MAAPPGPHPPGQPGPAPGPAHLLGVGLEVLGIQWAHTGKHRHHGVLCLGQGGRRSREAWPWQAFGLERGAEEHPTLAIWRPGAAKAGPPGPVLWGLPPAMPIQPLGLRRLLPPLRKPSLLRPENCPVGSSQPSSPNGLIPKPLPPEPEPPHLSLREEGTTAPVGCGGRTRRDRQGPVPCAPPRLEPMTCSCPGAPWLARGRQSGRTGWPGSLAGSPGHTRAAGHPTRGPRAPPGPAPPGSPSGPCAPHPGPPGHTCHLGS